MRRERPHPGAQLSFTDHDGYRFQAILTDQTDPDIAVLERRHRQRARVEDRIRDDKDTGLAKLPFKQYAMNEVWLEIVLLAHDLLVWTQALALDGELAKAEPKRLRYRLLHVAARLAFSGRQAKLHLPARLAMDRGAQGRVRETHERSPPRPADHQPPRHHPPSRPPGHRPRSPLPETEANTSRRSRGNAPRPPDHRVHHHDR